MKKRKIILSYDYELFFGIKSGTIQRTIIEPTYRLLDVMEACGFRGNFFVDYLMFRELEKQTDKHAQADLYLLKTQIRDIIRRGHRIELHIHPHWIDASYNNDGTWNFENFSHYSLSSLSEYDVIELFVSGVSYLTALAREIDPAYRIVAFRAGGWAVQPFNYLKKGFIESGIVIDSSTSYGAFKYSTDSYYDFRKMPDKLIYHFEEDVCLENKDGKFIEVPITSFHRNPFFALIDRFYGRIFHCFDKISDGTHVRANAKMPCKIRLIDKMKGSYKLMFTLSMLSPVTVLWALFKLHKRDLCCIIDHPKDFSCATESNIGMLGKFCVSVNYIDLINF